MEQQATYRNVTLSVRTPRFAVLIDKGSPHWHSHIESIIQTFTQTWGGEYFLIIPTDGKTIDEKFWGILEAYSPDKIGCYVPTLLDVKDADPDQYQKIKEDYKRAWPPESDEEFEESWDTEAGLGYDAVNSLLLREELLEELKNRLAPFHYDDHIVNEYSCHGESLGFPFTDVLDIVDYANDKPEKIIIPKQLTDNRELRLIASSRSGTVTSEFIEQLRKKDIAHDSYLLDFKYEDYILVLESGGRDIRSLKVFYKKLEHGGKKYPETGFTRYLPFRISTIELEKYYRADIHQDEGKNLIVVIGDEVTDYCLYYCLSRIYDGVYWLPDKFLTSANDKVNANKQRKDEEREKFTATEGLTAELTRLYLRKISYGHKQERINITSTSLDEGQLQSRKAWMGNIYPLNKEELLASVIVTPLSELPISYVGRVIETNNYANQQNVVFQGGKSVSRLNTPKPKNFSYIDPTKHRWITSINIDRYSPPALPFLAQKIFESLPASYDMRVAIDGLAYLCPHFAYLGGDIDVNILKPTIRLVDETELFALYFQHSGYDIELSDKGSYLKDTIERFGSLQAVADFFRVKQHRDVFDQYITPRKDRTDHEVIWITTEKRAYLSFIAFSRKLGNSVAKVTALIDELTAKDILRRGFIFQCSRCRLAAWYDIGEVSREFQCKRCDLVQLLSQRNWKSPEEPRWYYRLVETVYLFYESHSHLTALALDKLRQQSKEAFHYICETNIKESSQGGKGNEIDVLAISDGKLILGECKDCKPEPKDLDKYQSLLSKLKIKPDRFVLATTETAIAAEVKNKLATIGHADVLLRSDLLED